MDPNKNKTKELGFGTNTTDNMQRLINPDGTSNVRYVGTPKYTMAEVFHWLTRLSWARFLSYVVILYAIVNFIFALFYYWAGVENLGIMPTNPALDILECFFFSTQTFTTVGFGKISPTGISSNVIASIESLLGVLTFALVTGSIYGRFSRPVAHIVTSDNILVSPYKDITGLMFRIASKRKRSMLIQNEIDVSLGLNEEIDGIVRRRFYILELELQRINFLNLSWTVVHPIDEDSPLYGLSPEDIAERKAEFIILYSGKEETTNQTVMEKFSYFFTELVWNAKFKPMVKLEDDGARLVDLKLINDYLELQET
jgi:inward rectifier potassium channel